jgi:serine/threonine-protein kinase
MIRCAARGAFAELWQARVTGTWSPNRSAAVSSSVVPDVTNLSVGEIVAVKRLQPEWMQHPTARQLLNNEAEVLARVRSPYVVRLHCPCLDEAAPSLVCEWLEGCDLESLLPEGEPLPLLSAVWYGRQIAAGIHDLHSAGFVHGDIKPANVFVQRNGAIKLIDLGFAAPIQRGLSAANMRSLLVGTPEYLAPEAAAGEPAPREARDLYSLGIVLFRLFVGRLPFEGDSVSEILRSQLVDRHANLRRSQPGLGVELCQLVDGLLRKQPLRRLVAAGDALRTLIRIELQLLQCAVA